MKGLLPAAAVAALAGLAAIPTEVLASLPILCVWRTLLDVECLGCGMTRALSIALHGHMAEAVAMNRGVVVVLPAALLIATRGLKTPHPQAHC
jgi:BarA-like signal transduction histidine kinase